MARRRWILCWVVLIPSLGVVVNVTQAPETMAISEVTVIDTDQPMPTCAGFMPW